MGWESTRGGVEGNGGARGGKVGLGLDFGGVIYNTRTWRFKCMELSLSLFDVCSLMLWPFDQVGSFVVLCFTIAFLFE